ncbi:MAG: DUF177 domain-containing protein [Gemmatimonadetes bacterium]|nr:DUF177 domain-containing protein [Gemmatimonadota bacterium]
MLKVDLARLESRGTDRIDAEIAVDQPLWAEIGVAPAGGWSVRLEARMAGHDVIVKGRVVGEVLGACRRCLAEARCRIDEPLLLVFRSGINAAEAEDEESYVLPAKASELDLLPALREHLLLLVPGYVLCSENCRGRCAGCGVDLNRESCRCTPAGGDERWAALRGLAK